MARRLNESEDFKKLVKYFYDCFIFLDNPVYKKAKAKEFFNRDYAANPEKYRKWRKKKQAAHNIYCLSPQYKKYKKKYDRKYRCKKKYGEFAEAASVLFDLEKAIDNRLAVAQNGLINKSQIRKRKWQKQT